MTTFQRRLAVGAGTLAFVYLFFLDYLPPFRRYGIPSDLPGYHYPLVSFIIQTLKQGRFPLWDPSIYCGISLVGNLQAAIFYPVNWVFYLAHAGAGGVTFKAFEFFSMLHAGIAFLLAFGWLRERWGHWLAAILGAAVFAFGGYFLSQMVHAGVVNGFAWFPLGMWGIDRARQSGRWRALWMLAAASALVFLSGYPATWLAFAVCVLAHAAAGTQPLRWFSLTLAALALSGLLCAVQLLPALDAARLVPILQNYGGWLPRGASTYLAFLLPNYFDGRIRPEGSMPTDIEYFYLGLPFWFALVWLLGRWRCGPLWPGFAVAAPLLFLIQNPYNLGAKFIALWPVLPGVAREYNLLAGLPLAAAMITAAGIADFLNLSRDHQSRDRQGADPRDHQSRDRQGTVAAFRWFLLTAIAAWCLRQLVTWAPGGTEFAAGWMSLAELAVTLVLFAGTLVLIRRDSSRILVAALLLLAAVDYKVYGTGRGFNTTAADPDPNFRDSQDVRIGGHDFAGMDPALFKRLKAAPEFRVAVADALHSTELRIYGLATPQGFDPMLPSQYHDEVTAFVPFDTDRLFQIDPGNQAMLRQFGVRFIITRQGWPVDQRVAALPHWRLLQPDESHFRVYEYSFAQPAYRWTGSAQVKQWLPERRVFSVDSPAGGAFALLEQNFPGWSARVDGQPATIARWSKAFQSVTVPQGRHQVAFAFMPKLLWAGAVTSAAAWLVLVLIARRKG
ncbi:MAG: hypothetical protein ACKV22_34535 [Bryobacteraceae bacterium]